MPLIVCEIFTSIQGESSYSGLPCMFIRLSGCNLNCTWCDTLYASGHEGTPYHPEKLAALINSSETNIVEFTGGEPLLQKKELLKTLALIKKDKTILIETNGSVSLKGLSKDIIKIVDIKLPGSGEYGSFLYNNLSLMTKNDEIKFVVSDIKDYETMKTLIKQYGLEKKHKVLISRTSCASITDREIAELIINDRLDARYQIQLHKYIWKDEKGR